MIKLQGSDEVIDILRKPRIIKFIKGNLIIEKFVITINELFGIVEELQFKHPFFEGMKGAKYPLNENYIDYFIEADVVLDNDDSFSITEDEFTRFKTELSIKAYTPGKDSLDIDYQTYYPSEVGISHPKLLSEERMQLIQNLNLFVKGKNEIYYLTGPCSIGKSVSLLLFQRVNAMNSNIGYFNCKTLSNIDKDGFISIFKTQFFYLSKDYNEMNDLLFLFNFLNYRASATNYCSSNSFFLFIKLILKHLIKLNKPFTLILDQYKLILDQTNYYLKEYIELINNTKIKIIVCSSINNKDIRNVVKKALQLKFDKNKKIIYEYIPSLIDINVFKSIIEKEEREKEEKKVEENKEEKKTEDNKEDEEKRKEDNIERRLSYYQQFNFLPKYYYKLCNLTDNEIEQEIEEIKEHFKDKITEYYNDNFGDAYRNLDKLINLIGLEITKDQLETIINDIPLKYLLWTLNDITKKYTVSFFCDAVKEVFHEVYKEFEYLRFLTCDTLNDKAINELTGERLELFVNMGLKLNYNVKTTIKVDSLVHFGSVSPKNFKSNKALIIQRLQNARTYDSAIIDKKERSLILFQITIAKKNSERITREKLMNDYQIIIQQIQNTFSITIPRENYYFYYVFLKEKLDTATIDYCKLNRIGYLIFSIKDNEHFRSQELSHKWESNVFLLHDKCDLILGKTYDLFLSLEISLEKFLNRKRIITSMLNQQSTSNTNNNEIQNVKNTKKKSKKASKDNYAELKEEEREIINKCERLISFLSKNNKKLVFLTTLNCQIFRGYHEFFDNNNYYIYNAQNNENLYVIINSDIIKATFENNKITTSQTNLDDLYSNCREVYLFGTL